MNDNEAQDFIFIINEDSAHGIFSKDVFPELPVSQESVSIMMVTKMMMARIPLWKGYYHPFGGEAC